MTDRTSTPAQAALPDAARKDDDWMDAPAPPGRASGGGSAARRLAVGAALAAMPAVAVADALTGPLFILAFLYFPVLFLCWWVRDRRVLWLLAAVSVAATFAPYLFMPGDTPSLINRTLAGVALLAAALLFHFLIGLWEQVDAARAAMRRHMAELEALNRDLAAREEEIARQNEELQNQAEELERQTEELRAGNEELAGRERTLEGLLSLSRALTTDLLRGQVMERICEAMGNLLQGSASAAAILEQEGEHLVIRCHTGFGPAGPREDRLPAARSFASLVMTRGKTGYLEDAALRPDLALPQPKVGPEFVSVLAAPLRVGGWPVGVIAIYNPQPTVWPEQQVNLLESLAAQASVSLEAAHLFEGVERERRRIETVLRTVPFGVAVADARHADVRLNPAGAALLNLPADVNLASPDVAGAWQMYRGGQLVPRDAYPLARAIREGAETHAEEFELVRGGRRPISLLLYARPIKRASGDVLGAVAAFVDITTQKELQRELDVRRREAEEASVRKTRFLAAVSHDIRTPANAISLLAELIRRTAANPALVGEIPELARELQQSAAALVNLLSDVLDLARFDSGRIELQESEFPLGRLLADEVRGMQPLAREKNLILELDPPDESLWVRADRIKLARVLGNLMGNAIKFTESGGVKVAAGRGDDGSVHIRVSDTGVGIAPEHQRHIFDEFFQLRNPERDRNKGTGLGLTICKRLVDAMEGRLQVQSTPGKGSVFTVTLPASAVVPQPVVH